MKLLRLVLGLAAVSPALARVLPESYDVVFKEQAPVANGSSFSMPLGGGDMGLNVWAENNTVLFYVAKDACFDENNSMLKLGRVRLTLDPNPFTSDGPFEQKLFLEDGHMHLKGKNGSSIKLWVDVFNPVVHVDITTGVPSHLIAAYEGWRNEDHVMTTSEQAQSSWSFTPNRKEVTRKDKVAFWKDSAVLASHRNVEQPLFDATLEQQELTDYKDQIPDPGKDNTFGMLMFGRGLKAAGTSSGHYVNTTFQAWKLESLNKTTSFKLTIVAHQNQTESYDQWEDELMTIKEKASCNKQDDTVKWWNGFWERSHIIINADKSADDEGFQVGRNYNLFRYMLGCNAMSKWPTRFNGALFTFDPVFVDRNFPYTPDFRKWGGGTYTAMNQRLEYWPLLKTGDWDLMKPQLDFYKRTVDVALLRGRVYREIDHATFTEQIDNSGLPQFYNFNSNMFIFKTKRPLSFNPGDEFDAWLIWLGDTVLEFAMMALDATQYTDFDVSPYMPFIEHSIMWHDVLYQQLQQSRDTYPLSGKMGNESLVIYPGSSCETYKGAYNPTPTISALRAIVARILQVDPPYAIGNTTYYKSLLARVPKTPLRVQQDKVCIAPAEAYARIQNTEVPQMYPIFPWHEFGVGEKNLSIATNTYLYDTETQEFHGHEGWKQDVIWLADMGLTEEAKKVMIKKLGDNKVNKFPAFWGPGFDWTPQMDTGGTGMIALQEMLLQTYNKEGKTLRLVPTWPEDWTADFKLHAPLKTLVTGRVVGGKLEDLSVEPKEREADVVIGQD